MVATINDGVSTGRVEVPPAALASELDRIRREAATIGKPKDSSTSQEPVPHVRATLSNVVLFTVDQKIPRWGINLDEFINALCVSHPSRIFVVDYVTKESAGASFKTSVSSRRVKAHSGAIVCSEEIYLSVSGSRISVVPNLLLSLLVPDIEVVLLPLCDPTGDDLEATSNEVRSGFQGLLEGIKKLADVVLYDSCLFAHYRDAVSRILLPADGTPRVDQVLTRDLTWNRLGRWRSLIAEQFDTGRVADIAESMTEVTFSSLISPEAPTESILPLSTDTLLLFGWITSSLAWDLGEAKIVGGEVQVTCRDAKSNTRYVLFRRSSKQIPPSDGQRLSSVTFALNCEGAPMRMKIDRSFESNTVEVSTEFSPKNANACEFFVRKTPMPVESSELSVIANMRTQGYDRGFVRSREKSVQLSNILDGLG